MVTSKGQFKREHVLSGC